MTWQGLLSTSEGAAKKTDKIQKDN